MTVNEIINAMNVEEKAQFYCEHFIPGFPTFSEGHKQMLIDGIKVWLESEVEDDG